MVTTTRSYGSSVSLNVKQESSYGVNPGGNFEKLPFQSTDFGGEQSLIDSAILGLGREPRSPFSDILRVDGSLVVPVETRDIGRWLKCIFGTPVVTTQAASGTITFTANPSAGHTITINGVTWTFVASGATGTQTNVGADLTSTLTALATNLNASANASITPATYSNSGGTKLSIVHDTAGTSGNSFTLASGNANGVVSAATLLGGAFVHTMKSGNKDLPSLAVEIAHENVPAFLLSLGVMVDSIQMNFQRTGGAVATLSLMAQDETRYTSTQAGSPTTRTYQTFNQFQGSIKRDGVSLGNVLSAQFTYSNSMERVETIRSDDKAEGVDPTQVSSSGTIELRYGNNDLLDLAIAKTPFSLELSYAINAGLSLAFTFHEVYLSRPKLPVSGPGGVQASFNWQGAYSTGNTASVTCVLKNDIASY